MLLADGGRDEPALSECELLEAWVVRLRSYRDTDALERLGL